MSGIRAAVTGLRGIPGVMGGVETHCEELMPRLAARGIEVTVYRRGNYVSDGRRSWHGVGLADIPSPKRRSFEAIVHTLEAVWRAKRSGADLVHIHAVGPGLAVPVAKLLGLKVVFTHHGFDYDRAKWGKAAKAMLHLGERFAVRRADQVIVISRGIEAAMREKYGRTDCRLIPNGAPPPRKLEPARQAALLAKFGLEAGKYFFSACRYVPEKRLHDLVEAYAAAGCKETKLVLAGASDFEDEYSVGLRRKAKRAGVTQTGFVRGELLWALWEGAKAFFLPSSHEGLPLALLEAMSHGVPAWASDIPANREAGLPEERYFPVGDTAFLRDKMRELDGAEAERIAYDLSRFDWEKIADATVEAYRAAAGVP